MEFKCEASDVGFIERAPLQFINMVDLKAPPEAVFASLADTDGWLRWFPDMKPAVWEGEPGVGTNRTVEVGAMAMKEHFVIWSRNTVDSFSSLKLIINRREMPTDFR
jgi:hypothetical protein